MKPATEGLGWLLLLLALYLLVRCAQAEEAPPCRRVGDEITCTAAGFKVLTDTLIDAQAASKVCKLALDDARGRIASCKADCPVLTAPVVPPAPPRSAMPAVLGAGTVAVGSAAIVLASALSSLGADWRAGLAAAGVATLSVGVVLVLP